MSEQQSQIATETIGSMLQASSNVELANDEIAIIIRPNFELQMIVPNMEKYEIVPVHVLLGMALTLRMHKDDSWVTELVDWFEKYVGEENKEEKVLPSNYEVWINQGQTGTKIQEYLTLEEALHRVEEGIQNNEGSFGIYCPDGKWHEWKE